MTAAQLALAPATAAADRRPRVTGVRLMAAGMLLLQLGWMVMLPPFRGVDEFDHVYKAAAVARGDWFPTPTDATRGTGAWVEVPTDIVQAAQPHCLTLIYTKAADCIGYPHGDTTEVGTGAGRYNPLFYAVVGTPALPFHGNTADYVMRIATILCCWLLFCAALVATRAWARTAWPYVALAVASTPVMIYSASFVAPNGVEIMAGMAFWAALIGLTRTEGPTRNRLLVLATVAGSVLVTVRSLGPVLALLCIATVWIATRPPRAWFAELLRSRLTWLCAAVVFVAAALSTAWVIGMKSLNIAQQLEEPITLGTRIGYLAHNVPLWFLQSIAAFPHRDEPTQPAVYACYLLLFIGFTVLGLRAARGRLLAAAIFAFVVSSAFPFALGLNPDAATGVWQGRYMLPYAVGIALLLGVALDGRRGPGGRVRLVGFLLFATAEVVSTLDVLHRTTHGYIADYDSFPHVPAALVATLVTLGSAALWWGATRRPGEQVG